MKNKIVFVIALFLCFWFAIGLCVAEEPRAKIEFVTKDADIGEVKKGGLLDFKVEVKNAGNQDLIIENVYSSCGCFQVNDPRWPSNPHNADSSIKSPNAVILKPGAKTSIAVALDTNKVTGQFEKQLHIISNDPEKKDAVWKIRGRVLDSSRQENVGTHSNNIGVSEYPSSEIEKSMNNAKTVMLFYLPGCDECSEIREKFLMAMKDKYKDKIIVVEYNIDNPESFAFMIDLQNKYDKRAKKGFFNPKPPAIFIEKRFLYGVKEIEKNLEALIK